MLDESYSFTCAECNDKVLILCEEDYNTYYENNSLCDTCYKMGVNI